MSVATLKSDSTSQNDHTISTATDDDSNRYQKAVKCKVKIYKISNMQRCPYIHEMKERLLGEQIPMEPITPKKVPTPPPMIMDQQQPVATIVKLNADGYGSHTSPTHHRADRTPLMTKETIDEFECVESSVHPKNAKTSLFIIMSFVYAKLLIVVCIAYVISDVVTHNISWYYYEGFFTYLYGMSILFLLYVFCFLLQESTCCSGGGGGTAGSVGGRGETAVAKVEKVKKPAKGEKPEKSKEKEKEKKKEEEKKKKEEKERLKKEKQQEKEKQQKDKEKDKDKDKKKDKKQEKREKFPRKMRDMVQQKTSILIRQSTYRRNSEGVVDAALAAVPVPVAEISAKTDDDAPVVSQEQQVTAAVPSAPSAVPPPPPPLATPTPIVAVAPTNSDVEAGAISIVPADNNKAVYRRKRKTTQNDQSHGSFFLRIGAIAFGLGTMIYNGLEFGAFFEVPFTSRCFMILKGVNPVLQMVFTFMQMYFIFMNSRLNIHRFKVVARFGLMHVVATNICVWIRTLVLEYIKEITMYHKKITNDTDYASFFSESVELHTKRNKNTVLGSHLPVPDVIRSTVSAAFTTPATPVPTTNPTTRVFKNFIQTTASTAANTFNNFAHTTIPTTATTSTSISTRRAFTTPVTPRAVRTTLRRIYNTVATSLPTTTTTPITSSTTTTTASTPRTWRMFTMEAATSTTTESARNYFDYRNFNNFDTNSVVNVAEEPDLIAPPSNGTELLDSILKQAFRFFNTNQTSTANSYNTSNDSTLQMSCGRVNIMGTIVKDSAPYLFPFIIEYSLIGAAVIYVMWKHIGRNPRYVNEEDLEHRLEVMLSRRAVAMAQSQHQGRVDCVGASKGLFFGLLLLVGSLICLILFFVLIHHPDLGLLAIYLADVSHCVLMVLSIIAIIVGFIRVQSLKFKTEEQSDLNDILLRVSAFGLFTYAVFSVIAGHLNAFTREPNLLVMVTAALSILQVILQLLFIADVSRRRVYLPEHDRSKPGRQVVTFLLICNVTMWIIYTFETQKVEANPVQLEFYGFLAWAIVQRFTLPLCIFHRFHSAVTLAEIWKTSYKVRLE